MSVRVPDRNALDGTTWEFNRAGWWLSHLVTIGITFWLGHLLWPR